MTSRDVIITYEIGTEGGLDHLLDELVPIDVLEEGVALESFHSVLVGSHSLDGISLQQLHSISRFILYGE